MPYMQKVVSDYLRNELVGTRVVSKPPGEESRDEGWVEVIQMPAQHDLNDPADRLVGFHFQFSCYAGVSGGMPEAERSCRSVCHLLRLFSGSFDAPTDEDDPVVVSSAKVTNGPFSLPDSDGFEPARDRFIADAIIYAHAVERSA